MKWIKSAKDYYYVFIDEQEFEYYGEPEDGTEIGYSELEIYKIPELVDAYDSEKIEELSDSRENYDVVGKALVKFWEGEQMEEVAEIVQGDKSLKDKIEFLSPPL